MDYSQFFKKKQNQSTAPQATPASGGSNPYAKFFGNSQPSTPISKPPSPSPAPTTPPQLGQQPQPSGFQKLMGGVGDAVNQEADLLKKKPKQEVTNLLSALARGAKTGTKNLLGLVAFGLEQSSNQNPLMLATNTNVDKKVTPQQRLSTQMYRNAIASETKDTSNMNAVQKFSYGMGSFLPATLIPGLGSEGIIAKGAEKIFGEKLIGKMMSEGAVNAVQSAALYNPQAHPANKQMQSFVSDVATNFAFGAANKLTGKAIKTIAIKPMVKAANVVMNPAHKFISQQAYQRIVPAMMGKLSDNVVSMDTKELFDVLHGNKTSFDTSFFSSPDWKDIVKQYGANPDNYPDRITVRKPAPMPVVEAMHVPKLGSSELHDVMDMHFKNAAASLAQGDTNGYAGDVAVMHEAATELEKRGYKVDREMLMNDVGNYSQWQRDYEEFSVAAADQEFKKAHLNDLNSKGLLEPLQTIKKIYALAQERKGYTDQSVSDAYYQWAGKKGYGGFDELGQLLRDNGYSVPENDPASLIEFANTLPTLKDVTQKLTPPKEMNISRVINDAIKPTSRNIDRPFVTTQAQLDKTTRVKENVGNVDQTIPPTKEEIKVDTVTNQQSTNPFAKIYNKSTIPDMASEVQSVFSPGQKGEQAKTAGGILRNYLATIANTKVAEHIQNKKYEQAFDKLSTGKQLEYASNYERTGDFGEEANTFLRKRGIDPTKYQQFYKQSTDQAHQILQDVFGLDGYVNNYIRHMFTFTNKNDASKFVQGFSQTLQKYSTSPLKQRKFATYQDAIDYMTEQGILFKVVESNPERLRQITLTNAKAAQAFAFAKNELKNSGLIRLVKPGGSRLPNEVTINDKWAQVMFKTDKGVLGLGGQWVAPSDVGMLINNAVSDGLFDNSVIWKNIQAINNHLNQFELGLSAFHAATTTVNSASSEMGLGVQELFTASGLNLGTRAKGIGRIIKSTSIIEPVIEDYLRGKSAINTLAKGDSPAAAHLMEKINKAGGRLNIENRYRTQAIDKFSKSIRDLKSGNVSGAGGAAYHILPAILEQFSKPIMENLVPRVKIGRFLSEGDSAISRATKNGTIELSEDQTRRILGQVWDKIDNIHGQMVQDNLFWKNSQKDIANLGLRSFGWSYGTVRAALGAGKEATGMFSRVKKGGELVTPAMGIAIAYPLIAAEIGGIIHYFNTGKAPQSAKDYYFPESGQTKPDGTPIRLSVPGYMKDVFSYAKNPLQTIINKASPEIQALAEVYQNKDYYGVMLHNPDDPAAQQWADMGKWALSKVVPFSITSAANVQQASGQEVSPQTAVESMLGFQKASATIDQSDTQNNIQQTYSNQFGNKTLTPQEAEVNKEKSQAKTAARQGDYSLLQGLVKKGVYTQRGENSLLRSIKKQTQKGTTNSQNMFSQLPVDQQVSLYNKMSPDEQAQYSKYLKKQAKQVIDNQ